MVSLLAQPLRVVLMPFCYQRNTANPRVIDLALGHCGNEFREWLTLLEKINNIQVGVTVRRLDVFVFLRFSVGFTACHYAYRWPTILSPQGLNQWRADVFVTDVFRSLARYDLHSDRFGVDGFSEFFSKRFLVFFW
tara:strand:- start:190 stop:597 length:408 start_codon:yes stop_codon:yes gene_type:complete